MVEIPDELRCLFTARAERRDGRTVIEVPKEEVERDTIPAGDTHRVAILGAVDDGDTPDRSPAAAEEGADHPAPPVEEEEVRTVTIETTGDQGDGIAKVERGYVVIVQGGSPGEEVTVEIATVRENFAIANPVDDAPT